jgi:hypothetical protein
MRMQDVAGVNGGTKWRPEAEKETRRNGFPNGSDQSDAFAAAIAGSGPFTGVLQVGLNPAPSRIEAQKFMAKFLGELGIAFRGWNPKRLAPITCFAILREETRVTSTDRTGTQMVTMILLFADGSNGPGMQADWFDHLVIPPAYNEFNEIELAIVRSPIEIEENYTMRMNELCEGAFCISTIQVTLLPVISA